MRAYGLRILDEVCIGFLKLESRKAADLLHPLPQSGTPFEGGLRVRAILGKGRSVVTCL